MKHRTSRRGTVLVVLLVLMAVIAAVLGTLTWLTVTQRQYLEQRHHRLQAEWLARGGVEQVHALIAEGKEPTGETWKPMESAEVKITIDGPRIVSEATYPADEPRPVVREAIAKRP